MVDPMMALVVGWTLVGAFAFTLLITCFSLVGWVKFVDPKQQRKLFGFRRRARAHRNMPVPATARRGRRRESEQSTPRLRRANSETLKSI